MTLAASGTTQCACTSMVLTRFPAPPPSRRPCACGAEPPPPPEAALRPAVISHPVKAIVAPVMSFLPKIQAPHRRPVNAKDAMDTQRPRWGPGAFAVRLGPGEGRDPLFS